MRGQQKKAGHYASGFLPANLSKEVPTYVVDINEPRNIPFLYHGQGSVVWGYEVDKRYTVGNCQKYQEKSVVMEPNKIALVVPYTSSEVDPCVLRNASQYFNKSLWSSDPDSIVIHNSKAALESVRTDAEAKAFADRMLEVKRIKTVGQYHDFKQKHGGNVVLKIDRSTEGVGIFIDCNDKSEVALHGGIKAILAQAQGHLIATPFFDTAPTGDMRVFGFMDPKEGAMVLDQGILRMAAPPTPDNPCPKCNLSSGGHYQIVEVSDSQRKIAKAAVEYYAKRWGINYIGYDLFADKVISEINSSPDGENMVRNGVVYSVAFYANKRREAMETRPQTVVVPAPRKEQPRLPGLRPARVMG
jgi:glutathione synthase/RimK-type ligase-like ATP-grasp enzyme